MYESTPGATVRGIAEDLGIERGALRHWLELYGTGKKTAADGRLTRSPLTAALPGKQAARLRTRVTQLEAENAKLTTEREILRSAAKYLAGETNW